MTTTKRTDRLLTPWLNDVASAEKIIEQQEKLPEDQRDPAQLETARKGVTLLGEEYKRVDRHTRSSLKTASRSIGRLKTRLDQLQREPEPEAFEEPDASGQGEGDGAGEITLTPEDLLETAIAEELVTVDARGKHHMPDGSKRKNRDTAIKWFQIEKNYQSVLEQLSDASGQGEGDGA